MIGFQPIGQSISVANEFNFIGSKLNRGTCEKAHVYYKVLKHSRVLDLQDCVVEVALSTTISYQN